MDITQHKAFLWKYKLSYGETRPKKGEPEKQVYPFLNIIVDKSFDDCSSEEVKEAIDACENIEQIFDLISDEWKDTYFMEVSNHLEQDVFSRLLLKLYTTVGMTSYMTEKNYRFEASRATKAVQEQLLELGISKKEE